ncbi:unnamed protein product [Oncorhynchus mykiss]|uniref:C2H2-type domain-containing protein n=1 Tax=Oncorhynchus mykiss TaxID=8022 RepID=A0A060WVL0_ONCMY|nr:unnamed protein product [Oncorhynchus mykiss]
MSFLRFLFVEQNLMTQDDPAESHDDIMEAEEEKESTKDHTDQMAGQTSVLPCSDQCDPDETSEESGSYKTDRKASMKSPCKIQQGAVFSGKILSFGCSECKGEATYSPNDLLKHFQVAHKGTLPTYPCDLCGFATNEFPALQRHRIGHRNTLVTCEICNDDVQYSLLLLTRHYIMSHSQNGHFHCEKCEFSTVDAGTFVQHIHHHNESQLKSRREYLTKHMVTVHGEEADNKNVWRATEDSNNTLVNSSPGLKLLLKKSLAAGGQSKESQWMSKLNSLPGVGLHNQNGRVLKPEKTLESQQFHERAVGVKKDSKKWFKGALKNEQQIDSQAVSSIPPPKNQEGFDSYGADALNPNNSNGLTVLMVKNKISIPPNCTTKVMGFKMVDGKKHLVLKVIPTAKPEFSAENDILPTEQEVDCPMIGTTSDGSKCSDTAENGENTSSPYLAEEDVSIEETLPKLEKLAQKAKHTVEQRIDKQHTFKGDQIPSLAVSPMTKESDHSTIENGKLSNNTADKMSAYSSPNVTAVELLPAKILTHNTMPSESAYETMLPKPVSEETINMLGVGDMSTATADKIKTLPSNNKPKTPSEPMTGDIQPSNDTAEKTHSTDINAENKNSPNQELFSFHNYSKETSSISSNSTQPCKNPSELSTEDESVWMKEWSLTLAASPQPPDEGVSDCGVEVDECIAIVEDLATPVETEKANHGHSGSTQVQPTVKMEECVPLLERATGSISSLAVLGRILEEHSDAIISHQLEKDRIGCSAASHDSVKPPTTMLRILKTAEGKQQMLLQTAKNRYAVPVQLQGNPGFKLITKSTPHINVSYVKPGIERQNKTTGLALTLNGGSASEKGAMLLSTVQPGSSTSGSHYLVNSTALKGPLVLSGAAHSSTGENTIKSPQTCYLVQRPVPVGQAPHNAGNKLARLSSQSPLLSRPVLAMSANSVNRSTALHTGQQAFLVRYISTAKSGMLMNSPDGKSVNQKGQPNESRGNKVVYKIVRTANGSAFLSGGTHSSANKPIYLATNSTQMPCFLMSSNKVSSGVKKLISIQNASHNPVTASQLSNLLSPQSNLQGLNKSPLDPRPGRQLSQRKRRRKALCDELPEHLTKARRLSSKAVTEKGSPLLWEPVPKDAERTLRLYPFSSLQEIKCPRRNQPVVVLNHPDTDIPEVASIMRSVNRYKGAVSKVVLSQNTVQALAELCPARLLGKSSKAKCPSSQSSGSRLKTSKSRVRERFLLKLKFRKSSRKKYEVVKSSFRGTERSSMFACWFCGRLFKNQEEWIGHGQRHLMEATRDWNKLF